MKKKSLKITKTRLAGLRLIAENEPLDAHSICYHLWKGDFIEWHGKKCSESDSRGPSPQAAARWSSSFLAPLLAHKYIGRFVASNRRYKVFIKSKGMSKLRRM